MVARRILTAFALLALLAGCGSSDGGAAGAARSTTSTTRHSSPGVTYPAENREVFLASCLDNARKTADGNATDEVLRESCRCVLRQMEDHYTFKEFAELEQDLVAGRASDVDSGRLLNWATRCRRQAESTSDGIDEGAGEVG